MNQIYKTFLASAKLEVAASRHCIFSNSSLVRSLSRSTKIAVVGSGKLCSFSIVLARVAISYIILFVYNPFLCSIQLFCFATGPAGFYATQHLINHGGCDTTVDIYERLPVPFGLVSLRFGTLARYVRKIIFFLR